MYNCLILLFNNYDRFMLTEEGFEALLKMESALKATLEKDSKWQSLRNAYYEKTELVAVKSTAGRWERGVVLNENANDAVGREIPTCEVQLIDRGPVIEVSMSRLCNLPLQFCYIPASVILILIGLERIWIRSSLSFAIFKYFRLSSAA